ncbi:MAG: hypothetical protein F4Y75_02600 [Acidimicrobiia bacterium]|nr:hypothetical protein [bacterium]MXZ06396.1 hypothetical protein [Acidimicrobiia bacterium]MYF26053.1 hypothetical protein [Acidimicrobiia bacterium]
MLHSVTVRGFKSIQELDHFELRNLNVLVGASGSGKSNLLSLFGLMAHLMEQRLQAWIDQDGGVDGVLFGGRNRTTRVDVDLGFGDFGYGFTLVPAGSYLAFSREEINNCGDPLNLGSGHYEAILPTRPDHELAGYTAEEVAGWRPYYFQDVGRFAHTQELRDNSVLKLDGSNLASFLHLLREKHPDHFSLILDTVRLANLFHVRFGQRVSFQWAYQPEVVGKDRPRHSP